jgi:RNA polymerase sigma factor (sigma-70 family)
MTDCTRERRETGVEFHQLLTSPHYERLREKLIRFFARRGCATPEDLADETITRVVEKLREIGATYEGDPVRYFYGVARNVYFEYTRRPTAVSFEENRRAKASLDEPCQFDEETRGWVEHCLAELGPDDRRFIFEYYQYEKHAKIAHRRELAQRLGIGLNALRLKAFRIRKRIHNCVAASSKENRPEKGVGRRNEMRSTDIMP